MPKAPRSFLIVLIVLVGLLGAFVAGIYFGFANQPAINKITGLKNKELDKPSDVDFGPFWKAWGVIDDKFVNGNATSTATTTSSQVSGDQERVWGAIAGMVASLGDPYSVFLPPVENKSFNEEIKGNFGGVGIEVGIRNDRLVVISPLPETPAKKAGVKSGDIIVAINDQATSEIDLDEAINLIRGEVGTKVTLTVFREAEKKTHDFSLIREVITIPTIETELLPEKIFVIRLFNFSANSPELFRQALREFAKAKTNKLILDLRGNPGGYLNSAVSIASWFLPANEIVAIESRGKNEEPKLYKSLGYDVFTDKLKMVILVDRGSASASEILAGALAEHGQATLVGEKTFGKGSVQELVPITTETSLKITIARWLTPKGVSISHSGLTPEVEVKIDEKAETSEDKTTDPFMEKAIEVLTTN